MTSGVVAVSYHVGLPYYLAHKPPALTAALVALGNYLLANVAFHYALAFKRGPGFPPAEDAAALPQVGAASVLHKYIHSFMLLHIYAIFRYNSTTFSLSSVFYQ